MNPVEIPQVSLQHYFELLKRRRWQVLPVSLVGLLIGGLVAFFIPRYYVAETLVVHQSLPGQQASANAEDPFRSIVDTAQWTIPQAIGKAMEVLGWEEARATGFELQENERAVKSRLSINDANQFQTGRDYAQIRVTFKDRDGARSADFLNALIDAWIEKRLRELRVPAEAERLRANEAVKRQRQEWDQLISEKQALERRYKIDPTLDSALHYAKMRQDGELALQIRTRRDEAERALAAGKEMQQSEGDKLANTERRVKEDPEALLEKARQSEEGLKLAVSLSYLRDQLANFLPGTGQYAEAKRAIANIEQKLLDLVGPGDADADGLVANEAYEALEKSIREREATLRTGEAELQRLQGQLVAEEERVMQLAEGFGKHSRTLFRLDEVKKDLEKTLDELRLADDMLADLGKQQAVQQPVRANAPPRPTEPNILLVALLGCVLGLGLAISLILVLDVLQGTFKTADEVERGLPVPVLGGMSHLETEVEREQQVRRRRRVSLVAAAFVFLCVALVTIFYVDSDRLPPVVRDLLAMLLGA